MNTIFTNVANFVKKNPDMKIEGFTNEELKSLTLDKEATLIQIFRKLVYGYYTERKILKKFEFLINNLINSNN